MSNYRIDQETRLARMFKALCNPHRLRIFTRLAACCGPGTECSANDVSACVGELGRDLNVAPSTVSHHVKELHQAGLLKVERRGQLVICSVSSDTVRMLEAFFAQFGRPEQVADSGSAKAR